MTKVCFVVGHEEIRDPVKGLVSVSDTPEAYWRVLIPARRFGSAVVLGQPRATERALAADIVWIHQPTCSAAASLADVARQMGKRVLVDFSEDIYTRGEQDRSYHPARLEAAERAISFAHLIVVSGPALAEVYSGPVRMVRPVLPLAGWEVGPLHTHLSWWSDGRQKAGFEAVAPSLQKVLEARALKLINLQYAHMKPLTAGLDAPEARKWAAARLEYWFEGYTEADKNIADWRGRMAQALVSLECYLPGRYRETVSDVALLRAAALGVPTVTTREDVPPGSLSAPAHEWAEILFDLIDHRERWSELSREARAWAETRSTFEAYEAIIEEVCDARP